MISVMFILQLLSRKPYHLLSKVNPLPVPLSHFPQGFGTRSMASVAESIDAANDSLQELVKNGGFDRVLEKVRHRKVFFYNSLI
jgi:hypothetical protein